MRVVHSNSRYLVILSVFAALATAAAEANLLSDPGFEAGINPLPPLGPVVGPPFSPGFWGAELGGEVTAEASIFPPQGQYMLYMENEGGTVTQTFQVVDVNAYASLIDSGAAIAVLAALYNGTAGIPGPTALPALLFYAGVNDWGSHLGIQSAAFALDSSPNTWESFVISAPVPVGTRWILAQLGYVDATLPFGARGYVDEASLRVIPEPSSLAALVAGLLVTVARRR